MPSGRLRGGVTAEPADPGTDDEPGKGAARGKAGGSEEPSRGRSLLHVTSTRSTAGKAPAEGGGKHSRTNNKVLARDAGSETDDTASPRAPSEKARDKSADRGVRDKENKAPASAAASPPSVAGDPRPASRASSGSAKDPQRADLFEDAPAPRAPRQREPREQAPKKPPRQFTDVRNKDVKWFQQEFTKLELELITAEDRADQLEREQGALRDEVEDMRDARDDWQAQCEQMRARCGSGRAETSRVGQPDCVHRRSPQSSLLTPTSTRFLKIFSYTPIRCLAVSARSVGRMAGELEAARDDLKEAQRDREELLQEFDALEEKARAPLSHFSEVPLRFCCRHYPRTQSPVQRCSAATLSLSSLYATVSGGTGRARSGLRWRLPPSFFPSPQAEEDLARAQAEWAKEEKRLTYEAARLRDRIRDAEAEAERWKKMQAAVETQTASLEDSGERRRRAAGRPRILCTSLRSC